MTKRTYNKRNNKMNDEMIKYKKVENERTRHMVNTLSVNTSSYIVDVLKSY